jgi:hypothetical protein
MSSAWVPTTFVGPFSQPMENNKSSARTLFFSHTIVANDLLLHLQNLILALFLVLFSIINLSTRQDGRREHNRCLAGGFR